MKIFIMGYGRHEKDCSAKMISEHKKKIIYKLQRGNNYGKFKRDFRPTQIVVSW